MDSPLTNEELDELESLVASATLPPWKVWLAEDGGLGGDSFIQLCAPGYSPPDMYVYHDAAVAPSADIAFIGAAREYLPRLIAEVRRSRSGA